MKYYLNIDGGLGDIFCKMRYPEFKDHPIQHVSELLVREPDAEKLVDRFMEL